jgi:hypothetical protein
MVVVETLGQLKPQQSGTETYFIYKTVAQALLSYSYYYYSMRNSDSDAWAK